MSLIKPAGLVAALLLTSSVIWAEGRSIGTDFIRMLDDRQPVGNSFNLTFQTPTDSGKHWALALALGDNNDLMLELGIRQAVAATSPQLYYQVGLALIDQRNEGNLGLSAQLGYEQAAGNRMRFFGAVKGLYVANGGFYYSPLLGLRWDL